MYMPPKKKVKRKRSGKGSRGVPVKQKQTQIVTVNVAVPPRRRRRTKKPASGAGAGPPPPPTQGFAQVIYPVVNQLQRDTQFNLAGIQAQLKTLQDRSVGGVPLGAMPTQTQVQLGGDIPEPTSLGDLISFDLIDTSTPVVRISSPAPPPDEPASPPEQPFAFKPEFMPPDAPSPFKPISVPQEERPVSSVPPDADFYKDKFPGFSDDHYDMMVKSYTQARELDQSPDAPTKKLTKKLRLREEQLVIAEPPPPKKRGAPKLTAIEKQERKETREREREESLTTPVTGRPVDDFDKQPHKITIAPLPETASLLAKAQASMLASASLFATPVATKTVPKEVDVIADSSFARANATY